MMPVQAGNHPSDISQLVTPAIVPVTVAYGNGIGPEIIEATLRILREAGAMLAIESIEVGERIYNMNSTSGILPSSWESLRRTKVLLKGPVATPQGGAFKSLDVAICKMLGLYANIRHVRSYHPAIAGQCPGMDMVIIRENEEDLHAGIEYRHSEDSFHGTKLVTRSGSERIIHFAFDYALRNNRRKVTCLSKDDMMKITDGLFHQLFDEIGKEYADIEKEHYAIDAAAARLASQHGQFDVIVTQNLYGDIISAIAAEISGSRWLAGSSSVGEDFAMFEAIHGPVPELAGQDVANPSGMIHAAIMMLVHIGQVEAANQVYNGWCRTLEDGIHTADMYREGHSREKVGGSEFAEAVIERLRQTPSMFPPASYQVTAPPSSIPAIHIMTPVARRELIGVDMFVYMPGKSIEECATLLKEIEGDGLELKNLSNKGLKIWPDVNIDGMHLTDQHRARFRMAKDKTANHAAIAALVGRAQEKGLDFTHIENLYLFDGAPGFSLGHGE